MEPAQLFAGDPDTRPYFITETQTGRAVSVHFEALTVGDEAELRGEAWSSAVFAEVWPEYVAVAQTRKLVCVGEQDQRIQGLLHIGHIKPGGGFLEGSLLESAPFNQHTARPQSYRGVGRVLVARLVVESFILGGQGRVLIVPRPGTEPFYKALGFAAAPGLRRRLALNVAGATALLQATLRRESESE